MNEVLVTCQGMAPGKRIMSNVSVVLHLVLFAGGIDAGIYGIAAKEDSQCKWFCTNRWDRALVTLE